MNLKRIITSETDYGDSVFMAYQSATDTAKEEQINQKYFIPARPVPSLYIEIPENSSLPLKSDEYIVKNIKIFIESGQISKARLLLSSIPSGISFKLDNWRRVLSIPKARLERVATGVDIKQNSSWLLNNSGNFKGKWVALKNGILLGSHENRVELHRQLSLSDELNGATFFKIGKD